MSDLSTMTAAELVERLAGFDHIRITHHAASEPHPVFADFADGTSHMAMLENEERYLVNLFMADRTCFVGHAPTLAAALEEALRKAENYA
jgi:hypothetical protein